MKNIQHIICLAIAMLGFSLSLFSQNLVDTLLPGTFNKVYKVKATLGSTYFWECSGGMILLGQGTNSVMVNWTTEPGQYRLSVVETNYFGCEGEPVVLNVILKSKSSNLETYSLEACANEFLHLQAPNKLYYKTKSGYFTDRISFLAESDTSITLYKVENNVSVDSTSQFLKVAAAINAEFSMKQSVFNIGDQFTAEHHYGPNVLVEWILNDSVRLFGSKISFPLAKLGLNKLSLYVQNAKGCVSIAEKSFFVEAAKKGEEIIAERPEIKFPNIFTPNNDGVNEVFKAYVVNPQLIQGFNLIVVDRWGKLMYETNDPKFEWDGKYENKDLAVGVYVFSYSGNFTSGENFKGTEKVTLSR